jgi:hypothetical protein
MDRATRHFPFCDAAKDRAACCDAKSYQSHVETGFHDFAGSMWLCLVEAIRALPTSIGARVADAFGLGDPNGAGLSLGKELVLDRINNAIQSVRIITV